MHKTVLIYHHKTLTISFHFPLSLVLFESCVEFSFEKNALPECLIRNTLPTLEPNVLEQNRTKVNGKQLRIVHLIKIPGAGCICRFFGSILWDLLFKVTEHRFIEHILWFFFLHLRNNSDENCYFWNPSFLLSMCKADTAEPVKCKYNLS